MLARARARVPRARLIEADMTDFDLGERFDAVICVFDTLNHLTDFERWCALFERVAAHLRTGGLFAFDVNTVGQLRRLAQPPPWTLEVTGATVTQHVEWIGDGRARLARRDRRGRRAPPRAHRRARDAARDDRGGARRASSSRSSAPTSDGAPATDESVRAYLAWRRR